MRLICVLLAVGVIAAAESDLFHTIRAGDVAGLKQALSAGADANAADERGTTALHYAALYATPEAMAVLIKAGARVNAANRAGVTPIFTAICDLAKVRLLVENGADVNVQSAVGSTPVSTAAGLGSGRLVVEYLLSKGAKPDASTLSGAVRFHPGLVARLLAAGVVPSRSLAMTAASAGDPALLRTILEKSGPPPPPDSRSKRTALMLAAYHGPAESVRLLLERSKEINVQDDRGRTALMHAAGSDRSDVSVVKLLLEHGADPTLKDTRGDTALDFARLRSDSAKIKALGGEPAAPAPAPEVKQPPPVRVAVERALKLFETTGPAFFKANACISCHHQSIPQMAAGEARRAGMVAPDPQAAKAVLAIWRGDTDRMWQSSCAAGGGAIATLTYGLVGLAASGIPADATIDAAVSCLSKWQAEDGHWDNSDIRQPLSMDAVKYTALAIRALQLYPLPGLKAEFAERIARGRAFIEGAGPTEDTQTLAFRVIGMKWAGSDRALIRKAAEALLAAQRADGGWSQRPPMPSDAYATGQAVWALWDGADVPRNDRAWQRGAQYLRATQLEDGSWHVRSRGFGFQPYRETGFPYGHDQWISSAATGFAVMALAPLIEPR